MLFEEFVSREDRKFVYIGKIDRKKRWIYYWIRCEFYKNTVNFCCNFRQEFFEQADIFKSSLSKLYRFCEDSMEERLFGAIRRNSDMAC